jgi:hypothetical protein
MSAVSQSLRSTVGRPTIRKRQHIDDKIQHQIIRLQRSRSTERLNCRSTTMYRAHSIYSWALIIQWGQQWTIFNANSHAVCPLLSSSNQIYDEQSISIFDYFTCWGKLPMTSAAPKDHLEAEYENYKIVPQMNKVSRSIQRVIPRFASYRADCEYGVTMEHELARDVTAMGRPTHRFVPPYCRRSSEELAASRFQTRGFRLMTRWISLPTVWTMRGTTWQQSSSLVRTRFTCAINHNTRFTCKLNHNT